MENPNGFNRGFFVSEREIEHQIKNLFKNEKLKKQINDIEYGELLFRVRKGTIYNTVISHSVMTDAMLKSGEKE